MLNKYSMKNLKKYTKYFVSNIISNTSSLINRNDFNSVTVLMLHNISKSNFNNFKELIFHLTKEYNFLTRDEFHLFLNGKLDLKAKTLFLTFDDGFYSNFLIAKEILDPLGIKAIFFVLPGFIDSSSNAEQVSFVVDSIYSGQAPKDLRTSEMVPMGWNHLSELINNGHSIGSHTYNHFRLSEIKENDLFNREIIRAGDYLEKKLGVSIQDFAYPFGNIDSINQGAIAIAKQRYKYIYSGVRGCNLRDTHPAGIKREVINVADSIKYNQSIISGGLSPFYYNHRRRLELMIK